MCWWLGPRCAVGSHSRLRPLRSADLFVLSTLTREERRRSTLPRFAFAVWALAHDVCTELFSYLYCWRREAICGRSGSTALLPRTLTLHERASHERVHYRSQGCVRVEPILLTSHVLCQRDMRWRWVRAWHVLPNEPRERKTRDTRCVQRSERDKSHRDRMPSSPTQVALCGC